MELGDLQTGAVVHGIRPQPVTVVAVVPQGDAVVNLIYRDGAGQTGEQLVYGSDLSGLSIELPGARWSFAADGQEFRLAAEALRIRMAGLHDPMLAVSSSDVRPLPHQIRAVYGELLPRTPLRFLLADDPGAGKTIMAGLYAKELMLRGDLKRMLIIAPGGLVDQWQDELGSKFDIHVEILSRSLIEGEPDGNPFTRHPRLIARMDQLARDEELTAKLAESDWDLIVVDEAHRMSANWWSGELRKTRRYELGQLLGSIARHLLLMSATPHAGSDENFQAFLALLDPDRFEGQFREGAHSMDTSGLMRRMVKEDLLTFEGKSLFPERRADTLPYQLSPGESSLYEAVTQYVREEMNRAESLIDNRRRTVGFALTVLQRRLASSTYAILRSLERRRTRLHTRKREMLDGIPADTVVPNIRLYEEDPDEFDAAESERIENDVLDAATAAQTAAELDVEIAQLDELVALASRVRDDNRDSKWEQVRNLLLDHDDLRDPQGNPRKLIIFTEHRDTLDYLQDRISNLLGRNDAVATIHGGTSRDERRRIREEFTHNDDLVILLATDAAGEGLNLQSAHLMINYDLPWNPNRIEQRFGRIHRIGQLKPCRLWNLVADDTREGQVYKRLLEKMEAQRKAYGGRLFDVLGDEAFRGDNSLRKVLMDAIRYGDDPARLEELNRVVDAEVSKGAAELIEEQALAREVLDPMQLAEIRARMDDAMTRRLQPYFIESFFNSAFHELGGRLSKREPQRFEIPNVPLAVRSHGSSTWQPIASKYRRVTFEPSQMGGAVRAELLAPGHPLMDAVVDLTIERHRSALENGAILVDPSDFGDTPHLLVALSTEIADGTGTVVSKRFSFVSMSPDGSVESAGPAPYLDSEPLEGRPDIAERLRSASWLSAGVDQIATNWAVTHDQPAHLAEVRDRLLPQIDKTRNEVRKRLSQQSDYLVSEAMKVAEQSAAGKGRKRQRVSPDTLRARADDLQVRLEQRMERLDQEARLSALPPRIVGAALIVPQGMLLSADERAYAENTQEIERRAVDLVLECERRLGRVPTEMPHNNKGFDIRSIGPDGSSIIIEVKGRIAGADGFFITYSEVREGLNSGDRHRLAMVEVSPDGPAHDRVRYVRNAFTGYDSGSLAVNKTEVKWKDTWAKGGDPA